MTTRTKRNALDAAFKRVDNPGDTTAPNLSPETASGDRRKRKDRANTVLIGGHFSPEVKQALRLLAAEENTTSQALLAEALNLLFVKKGKGKLV